LRVEDRRRDDEKVQRNQSRSIAPALALLAALLAAAPITAQHSRLFPPKDLGLLEGPDRDVWQRPEQVMDALGIYDGNVVADLGAGGGWFTVRLARRVGPQGRVYAEDVQHEMLEAIKRRVDREGFRHVWPTLGNDTDPGLPPGALDAVLVVDVYGEMKQPVVLLRNLARSLKPNGRIGIINFTKEGGGPGPPMEERVDAERVIREATAAGLRLIDRPNFLRYQYMLVFGR